MVSAESVSIRPPNAILDSTRLTSEARAVQALSGCVPYHPSGSAERQREFVVVFGQSR
jgi:hypothetical protein